MTQEPKTILFHSCNLDSSPALTEALRNDGWDIHSAALRPGMADPAELAGIVVRTRDETPEFTEGIPVYFLAGPDGRGLSPAELAQRIKAGAKFRKIREDFKILFTDIGSEIRKSRLYAASFSDFHVPEHWFFSGKHKQLQLSFPQDNQKWPVIPRYFSVTGDQGKEVSAFCQPLDPWAALAFLSRDDRKAHIRRLLDGWIRAGELLGVCSTGITAPPEIAEEILDVLTGWGFLRLDLPEEIIWIKTAPGPEGRFIFLESRLYEDPPEEDRRKWIYVSPRMKEVFAREPGIPAWLKGAAVWYPGFRENQASVLVTSEEELEVYENLADPRTTVLYFRSSELGDPRLSRERRGIWLPRGSEAGLLEWKPAVLKAGKPMKLRGEDALVFHHGMSPWSFKDRKTILAVCPAWAWNGKIQKALSGYLGFPWTDVSDRVVQPVQPKSWEEKNALLEPERTVVYVPDRGWEESVDVR